MRRGIIRSFRAAWAAPVSEALKGAIDRRVGTGLGLALICVLAGAGLAALAPVFLKLLLDDLYGDGLQALTLALLYAGCLGLGRIAGEGRAFLYGRAEQAIVRAISRRAFSHVLALPMRVHADRATGSLVQTIENGLQGCRLVLQHGVFTLLPGLVEIAVIAGILLWLLDGVFLAVLAVCALAYAAVFAGGARKVLGASRDISAARTAATAQLTDGLLNIETVKAFNGEGAKGARFDARLRVTRDGWRRFHAVRCRNGLLVAGVFTGGLLAVLLLAVDRIGRSGMTPGDLVLVSLYMMQIVRPMELLGFAARDIGQGAAFMERLNALLAETPERHSNNAVEQEGRQGGPMAIRFEAVAFAHAGGCRVVDDVSLDIPPGSRIALVGPSGSGKSTLIRLLLKFHEPDSGRILVDGAPLSELPPDIIRQQIAFIAQAPGLFNDTLAFNVGFGAPGAVSGEIDEALSRVGLGEVHARRSDRVGEQGGHLSGGERQRVAIARALMRRPRLLLADEPTSALDPASEAVILKELERASEGATVIMASHRLRAVMNADRIVVMSSGRIAECGTHDSLLERDGLYAQMWRDQTGGEG